MKPRASASLAWKASRTEIAAMHATCDCDVHRPQESQAISETLHRALRMRWKVASDLRTRVAKSERPTSSFYGDSGHSALSMRCSLAIANVRFWCARLENLWGGQVKPQASVDLRDPLGGWGRVREKSRCRNVVGPASIPLLLARPEENSAGGRGIEVHHYPRMTSSRTGYHCLRCQFFVVEFQRNAAHFWPVLFR